MSRNSGLLAARWMHSGAAALCQQHRWVHSSSPSAPPPPAFAPETSRLASSFLRELLEGASQPQRPTKFSQLGVGSFHSAAAAHFRDVYPIMDLRKLIGEAREGGTTSAALELRTQPHQRSAAFPALLAQYADLIGPLRSRQYSSPQVPSSPDPLSSERSRQDLAWFVEEVPLLPSSTLMWMMNTSILKGSPDLALGLFSLWIGAAWSGINNGGVLNLATLFQSSGSANMTAVAVDFAIEDAQRHRAAFPFEDTFTLRAAEGGLLGATAHVKSPLCVVVWVALVKQYATVALAAHGKRTTQQNQPTLLVCGEYLALIQRWWSHALVPREEWGSLQQLLLEMAAGAAADVVLRRTRVAEIRSFLGSTASFNEIDENSMSDATPVEGSIGIAASFNLVFQNVSDVIEESWRTAALREDPRLSAWFSSERARIGNAAVLQFAHHYLFQKEHHTLRFFSVAQPWVRLSSQLGFLSLATTTKTGVDSANFVGASVSVVDTFRRLWLLHVTQMSPTFTTDTESMGRVATVADWFKSVAPVGEGRDDDFSVLEVLKASQARETAISHLVNSSCATHAPRMAGASELIDTSTISSPVPYHLNALHEAAQLVRWILQTHFAQVLSQPQAATDRPQLQAAAILQLTPVLMTGLGLLASFGDQQAVECLLLDVRCPPQGAHSSAVDGVDMGGDQLDEGLGTMFVRGLGRSGTDALPTALLSWWKNLQQIGVESDEPLTSPSEDEFVAVQGNGELEAHRVMFYYWAHTVNDTTAESELFQSLLWQPANLKSNGAPLWLRLLAAVASRRSQIAEAQLKDINIAWMVRSAWDYVLTLAMSRDLPPPSLAPTLRRSFAATSDDAVGALRRQVLMLLLVCAMQHEPLLGASCNVGDTFTAPTMSSRKSALIKLLASAASHEGTNFDGTSEPSLRDAVMAALKSTTGSKSSPAHVQQLKLFAFLGDGRSNNHAVQHHSVVEKVVASMLTLFWHDLPLLEVCLGIATARGREQRVVGQVDHGTVRPLLVSIMCRQLVLFPTADHRRLVEPFLLAHAFSGASPPAADTTSSTDHQLPQEIKELLQHNYYVAEVFARLIPLEEDRQNTNVLRHPSAVLFPSLQLQDHQKGVHHVRSVLDTRRCAVLPFSIETWSRRKGYGGPQYQRRHGSGHTRAATKSVTSPLVGSLRGNRRPQSSATTSALLATPYPFPLASEMGAATTSAVIMRGRDPLGDD